MDPLYLRKLRIDRQIQQQMKNLNSAEKNSATNSANTSGVQNNEPVKSSENMNNQANQLVKDIRDEVLAPRRQRKYNYIASMERSDYVKKMMNLPRTLPELLIQLQRPNYNNAHNVMNNQMPQPDVLKGQVNNNEEQFNQDENGSKNNQNREDKPNSNQLFDDGFETVLRDEVKKQDVIRNNQQQQETTNNIKQPLGENNKGNANNIGNVGNNRVVNLPNNSNNNLPNGELNNGVNNGVNSPDKNLPNISNKGEVVQDPHLPIDEDFSQPQQPQRPDNNLRPNNPMDNRPNLPNQPNRPNMPDQPLPPNNNGMRPNSPLQPDRPMPPHNPNQPNRPNLPNQPLPPNNNGMRPNPPLQPDRPMPPHNPNQPNRPNLPNQPLPPNNNGMRPNPPLQPDRPMPPHNPNQPNRPNLPNVPNQPLPPNNNGMRPNPPLQPDRPMPPHNPNQPNQPNRPNMPNQPLPPNNNGMRPNPPLQPDRPMPPHDNMRPPHFDGMRPNSPFPPNNNVIPPNSQYISGNVEMLAPRHPHDIHRGGHIHEKPPVDEVSQNVGEVKDTALNDAQAVLYQQLSMNDIANPTLTQMRQRLSDDAFELLFTGMLNLNDLSNTIKHNGKDARSKLILALANASKQGVDNTQISGSLKMVSESMAMEENNPASILKNIILLYLPWYPLQEGVGFNLAIETMPNMSDFSSLLKVFIQTRHYGNVNGSLILMNANNVDMQIQCDDKFPKDDLLERMKEVTQNHTMQSNITVEQRVQMENEVENQQAKVNLSSTYDLNPFLLLMAHSFIKNTIIIDGSANV